MKNKKFALKKYPKVPYCLLELPCRFKTDNERKMEVWNGNMWLPLEIKFIK